MRKLYLGSRSVIKILLLPTNRLLNQYEELGLPISPGTIAGGLERLKELFQPVYNALFNHQMTEDRLYNDESSWKVFESVDGKIGNRWWFKKAAMRQIDK
ncbi:MAG: transposase [Desulfobacterales bacterium]|nr:transposase [Desulfobacterales bacterium]